jgi:hypothetical protein
LRTDPNGESDLATNTAYTGTLVRLEHQLPIIVLPREVDRRANADQQHKITAAGGKEAVIAGGVKIPYAPAP